jgi:hypothetical protein
MSSRQEEKEQRKQERLEREAAAAAAAKRKRLVQLIGGVVVACAIIAGVAFAVSRGGADKVDDSGLAADAKAAGCVYKAFPNEGREHSARKLTAANYKTNPPTSGTHNPNPAADGLYVAGNEPDVANWVHTLEHGRVLLQYKPGTSPAVITQLTSLFNENVAGSGSAYHSVLMQNNTKMTGQVAAVAWRHSLTCAEFTPKAIDAMRAFRTALIDKGPEVVP